jgi:putative flippase GtrA
MRRVLLYLPALGVYVAIGGVSALVEWAIFYALLTRLGINYVIAALGGFALATLVNYVVSRRYGFLRRDSATERDSATGREIATIYVVSLLALAVNLGAMIALIEMAGAHVLLAKVLGTGCGFLCNFAGRQFWVFNSAPRWRMD